MERLHSLLESCTTPIVTAFLLGLLTALSPCPLATNVAAIGYIGKNVDDRKRIFRNGMLYTLGRVVTYTLLGVVLIALLKGGSSLFGIQKFISKYGELILPPTLLMIGLYMLFGGKLRLPSFGFNGNGEGLAKRGGLGAFLLGVLFALAFCPSSVVPVVEVFVAKCIPLGTAIAFMMAVIGLSIPEATMLKKVMTWRLIGIFFGVVTLLIVISGYLFNWLI